MSEPITKRLHSNISSKKNSIKSQTTYNNNSKQNKLVKNIKPKSKNKPIIKKDNTKIKVKRKLYKLINSRNEYKESENYLQNNDYILNIKDINANDKEININKEKYTKDSDSDLYPKAFYINNYNNNYININNLTIENNNNDKEKNQEKEKEGEKENDKEKIKNDEIKKSFSDKNLLNKKKSLKEDIIICDEQNQKINNDKELSKDISLDKSIEFYSGEKGSNLSCLLSYSKNGNSAFDSFCSKSKKYMHRNHHESLNNINTRKKEKGKKRMINISLNYRNRNDVHNIYSNNKFYHKNNKTFFRESKSVKNFLLDLRKKEKEKDEKINNSVTFRKSKKIKFKEKESSIHAESVKKIFKLKNTSKIHENKNSILSKNLSLKKNNAKIDSIHRDLSHSITKKNYNDNKNANIIKKGNKEIKKSNNIEKQKEEKKQTRLVNNKEKINIINKLFKEKKDSKKNISNNKQIKSKDTSKSKTKCKKNNENKNKNFTPLSLNNSNYGKKLKPKEYPNMVKKDINNYSFENCTKKIKNISVICKVGDSGTFKKKLNQDNYFIMKNFLGNSDYTFLGVCDGHGIYGQNISSYLKEHLPMNVQEELIDKNISDLSNIDITFLSEIIESTYKSTNNQMNSDERIDSSLSGSTCIAGLYNPLEFFCINVGDSRCVLFKYFPSSNSWSFSNLSRDHKPSDSSEKARIIESGGIVEPYINEKGLHVGPERVWVKDIGDKISVPGLAMSRSFGDQIAHSVGVVVSPEILEHHFCEEDKVILLASDGIWEFLENDEIVNIIKKYYEENNAADALEEIYKEADKKWRENEGIVDDITAIILFLE